MARLRITGAGGGLPLAVATVAWCTLLQSASVTPLEGQIGPSQHIQGTVERRIESISPRQGPPGTRVRITTGGMPARTPVRVGIGSMGTGFEAFDELMTTDGGELSAAIPIPTWASWDEITLFIVFDIYFRPIAFSDVFHATDERGLIRRQGVVRQASPGCFSLLGVSGTEYALIGERSVQIVQAGDEIIVEGRPSDAACSLQNSIEVVSIQPKQPQG